MKPHYYDNNHKQMANSVLSWGEGGTNIYDIYLEPVVETEDQSECEQSLNPSPKVSISDIFEQLAVYRRISYHFRRIWLFAFDTETCFLNGICINTLGPVSRSLVFPNVFGLHAEWFLLLSALTPTRNDFLEPRLNPQFRSKSCENIASIWHVRYNGVLINRLKK